MSATPTIYFIDDSATMREVIKIAFRRENINVIAYNDAASALGQIESARPDIVITDVIMPDKDGYEVCQFIKQHPSLGKTPVILMSSMVNRSVAEKAFAVKADELIRKPFQPQDLITRVKHLLNPGAVPAPAPVVAAAAAPASAAAAVALSSIFQSPARPAAAAASPAQPAYVPAAAAFAQSAATARPATPATSAAAPSPIATAFAAPAPAQSAAAAPMAAAPQPVPQAAPPQAASPRTAAAPVAAASAAAGSGVPMTDLQKVRMEILRLEGLVKKLQSELQAEREYTKSLEEHFKTMQHN